MPHSQSKQKWTSANRHRNTKKQMRNRERNRSTMKQRNGSSRKHKVIPQSGPSQLPRSILWAGVISHRAEHKHVESKRRKNTNAIGRQTQERLTQTNQALCFENLGRVRSAAYHKAKISEQCEACSDFSQRGPNSSHPAKLIEPLKPISIMKTSVTGC